MTAALLNFGLLLAVISLSNCRKDQESQIREDEGRRFREGIADPPGSRPEPISRASEQGASNASKLGGPGTGSVPDASQVPPVQHKTSDHPPPPKSKDALRTLFKSLPPGRGRTVAVHGMLGDAADNMDVEQLKRIYEALPFGADRVYAGSLYAEFAAKRDGIVPALEAIASFETEDERIASLITLLHSDEFRLSVDRQAAVDKANTIKATLGSDHQLAVEAVLGDR